MKIDRLFADVQLAEMEHNAFKSEASAEKLELAKLAYESALAKEEGASVPKVEEVEPAAPVQNTFNTAALELLNTVGLFSEEDRTEIIKSFFDRKIKNALGLEADNVDQTTPEQSEVSEVSALKVENVEKAAPIESKVLEASAPKVEKIETAAPVQSEAPEIQEEKKTV